MVSVVILLCHTTAGGVASVGERVTFSSPDENARAGETAPKLQCQSTLATPLVVASAFYSSSRFIISCLNFIKSLDTIAQIMSSETVS